MQGTDETQPEADLETYMNSKESKNYDFNVNLFKVKPLGTAL